MKLNVVIWESLNFLGGGQKLALEIAEALKDTYNIHFLLPGHGELSNSIMAKGYSYKFLFNKNYSRGKKRVSDISRFLFYFPIFFIRSLRALIKIKPDLIYSNASTTFISSSIIGLLLKRPVIWNVHNYYQDRKIVTLLNIFGKLRSVKKIIFDSKALEKQFHLLSDKVLTVCPGIDLEKYLNFQKNSTIRKELNLDKDAHIIVQIAWVIETKGQHLLIDAAKYVYEKRKDVCFLIVGKNLEGEELYLRRLKHKIKEYKLEGVVRLLGFYNDIKSILRESFLNVISSFEGFSLVMLEAAALNVPTVGPNVGGPGVTIEDGRSGLIYKFKDPKDLASKILYVLEHKDFYNEIRKNAAEFVSNYTSQRYRNYILSHVNQTFH